MSDRAETVNANPESWIAWKREAERFECQRNALLEALEAIANMDPNDPNNNGGEGWNEWGEAMCFHKCRELATAAIKLAKGE